MFASFLDQDFHLGFFEVKNSTITSYPTPAKGSTPSAKNSYGPRNKKDGGQFAGGSERFSGTN
jgi:hypothetical protein